MLATYMRRMRNKNLEIGIAGSSCRPQKPPVDSVFRALWLASQTRDVQCYSPPSDAKLS